MPAEVFLDAVNAACGTKGGFTGVSANARAIDRIGSLPGRNWAIRQDVPARLTVAAIEHSAAGEVHGIGETSVPPVMPCVANAVYNATGVRITDLPLTPEKVLRALREQSA